MRWQRSDTKGENGQWRSEREKEGCEGACLGIAVSKAIFSLGLIVLVKVVENGGVTRGE